MSTWFENIKKFLYEKLIHINDSPQKIAAGFGLGVFFGILPGLGPVAAFAFAFIFQVNRVAAFTGGLATNTWLSLVTFVLATKIGASILGVKWQEIYQQCKALLKDFNWRNLLDTAVLEILKPVFLGYVVIGLVAGVVAYGIVLFIFYEKNKISAARHKKLEEAGKK